MTTFRPKGMIVPMVTPFQSDGALDEQALRRLTQRLITAGVHGLFPVGSSGEFWALNPEEGYRAIEIVVEEAAGQVPVYAGTGAIDTCQASQRAHFAEELGTDAIVVITPFYVAPTQEELYAHYASVADSTLLPVIPYNNPARTGGVNLEPRTVAQLAAIGNLVGIKDSSGNLAQTAEYINETRDDFAVFQGRDDLFFASLVMGAAGGIAATANVVPELVVSLYECFVQGDWERSRDTQIRLSYLRRALSWGTYPSVLKAAMDLIGESVGEPRRPVSPLREETRKALHTLLVDIGLAPAAQG
jgi:4-hydroxy-tetrahydrodipicolinate synthase